MFYVNLSVFKNTERNMIFPFGFPHISIQKTNNITTITRHAYICIISYNRNYLGT